MPAYNYKCVECKTMTVIKHGFNDKPEPVCTCGGRMKKSYTAVGVTFNGPGFYKTDSRSN